MSTLGKVVTGLVLTPIAVLVVGIGGCEARKAYFDWQVGEMCEKDGGVKVFEVATLNKKQFSLLLNQFGQLSPPLHSRASEEVSIVHTNTSTYIRRVDPEVRRDELAVIRKSDNKVLAVSISYSRVGGDSIGLHPSYFSCPQKSADIFATTIHQEKE